MKLPGVAEALVEERKIVEYLMNPVHPDGAPKARFFERAGYTREAWRRLAEDLRGHARENDITSVRESPYGTRYVVEGPVIVPSGDEVDLTTVWIVERRSSIPRRRT